MTQIYFPFDSGAGANVMENQWSLMARNFLATGVLKGQLNGLLVSADSTGLNVKVATGQAWLMGHFFQSDAVETLPIANADPANPRIDTVVVRLDWTLNTITFAVLQGVPGVTPAAPALTTSTSRWEIPLANVSVGAAAATIAVGNVTDTRQISSADVAKTDTAQTWTATQTFADIIVSTINGFKITKSVNAPANPNPGDEWYNTSTNRKLYWNGTGWKDPLTYQ